MSNNIYVTVDIPFDKAWDDLTDNEKKEYLTSNIEMIDTDELISELESRGYTVSKDND